MAVRHDGGVELGAFGLRVAQDGVLEVGAIECDELHRHVAVATVSLHLYMRMIETGRWLGFVPASVIRFGGKGMHLKILPVKVSSPPAPVGFITVKDRTLTPLAERFIECTRKVANSDTGRASMRRP